jgi:hypothetical protein
MDAAGCRRNDERAMGDAYTENDAYPESVDRCRRAFSRADHGTRAVDGSRGEPAEREASQGGAPQEEGRQKLGELTLEIPGVSQGIAENGGTAACIYSDAADNELNVVFDAPGESRSKFVSTDPSDIGTPAQAVSGLGQAAFSTTSYGHAEVDVFESTAKGFAVTLDPANGGSVTPDDLTEVVAVARAIVKG